MEHSSGIVRRVDDLGRVVIPKEIRRTLRIREGDPLELIIKDGELVFRKYSSMESLKDLAQEYLYSICEAIGTSNYTAYVTDRDLVVAVAGGLRINYLYKRICSEDKRAMDERKTIIIATQVIVPIIVDGDVIGVIGLVAQTLGSMEVVITEIAAGFLAKQLAI